VARLYARPHFPLEVHVSTEVIIDYRALREAVAAYDAMVEARPLKPPPTRAFVEAPPRSAYHALREDIRKGVYHE
jgi:hypothetical protein